MFQLSLKLCNNLSMTKEKSNIKSIILIIIVSLLVIIASCFVGAKLLIKNNIKDPPQTPISPSSITPTLIVSSEVNLHVADNTYIFSYVVNNLGSYNVNYYVENSNIAELEGNIIRPKRVGSTKIITTINTVPLIKKETILNILPIVTDVEIKIINSEGNKVNEFYTNTPYTLVVTENIETNLISEILYSDNITKFTFVKKENLSYYYTFQISEFGEFELRYKNKYFQKWVNFNAYKMPTDFNINITNSKIYLFDTKYLSLANSNNVFASSEFVVEIQENTNDKVELIDYDENLIEVSNNKITAKAVGVAKLKFKSSVSKVEKDIEIIVDEITLNKVSVNGEEYEMGSTININLNYNEEFNLIFSKVPEYSNDYLILSYNEEEVHYINGNIALIHDKISSTIKIKNKLQEDAITINLSLNPTYTVEVDIDKQNSVKIEKDNNVISVMFEKEDFVFLGTYLFNVLTKEKVSSQIPSVESDNNEICEITEILNGKITVLIKQKGTTTLKISYENFNTELTITIKVL